LPIGYLGYVLGARFFNALKDMSVLDVREPVFHQVACCKEAHARLFVSEAFAQHPPTILGRAIRQLAFGLENIIVLSSKAVKPSIRTQCNMRL
jgi:hypothetical protein